MIHSKLRHHLNSLLAFILLSTPLSALGQTVPIVNVDPRITYPSGELWGFDEDHFNGMDGWIFTVLQPLTITQVGWFDDGGDGLSRPFQIGLWEMVYTTNLDPTVHPAQLLGNSTSGIFIPAGTAAALNGPWRVVDLAAPLNLLPGKRYELGGLDTSTTPDVIKYRSVVNVNNPTLTSSQITLGAFFYGDAAKPNQPPFHPSNSLYAASGMELGPMLFTNAPEPSSLLLLAMGTLQFLARRRK